MKNSLREAAFQAAMTPFVGACFSLCAALMAAAPLCAQTYIIKNATVMTVSKGTFKGSILVRDGKIFTPPASDDIPTRPSVVT